MSPKTAALRPPALAANAAHVAYKPAAIQPQALGQLITRPGPDNAGRDARSWTEAARGGKHRPTRHLPTSADANSFMKLRISILQHHSAAVPHPNNVFTLACRICTFLTPSG